MNDNSIPSLDLIHEGIKVSFAFRTMEEIHAKSGNTKDIPHRHDYYTVLWASKACGEHYIDYKEFIIRPNYIFFVNPGQVHQVITFGEPEGFVLMFTREYLHQNMISEHFLTNLGLFSDSADTPPVIIKDDTGRKAMYETIKRIEDAFHSNSVFKHDQISANLKLFLIECNKYAPQHEIENTQLLQSGRQIVKEFKQLIEEKYPEWHMVNKYADKLHITADYLNSVIKTSIGKTAKEFIQNRICLEAKRLGVHTHLSLKEIAYKVGFDDPSHFSKFFKKHEGISFSEFKSGLD